MQEIIFTILIATKKDYFKTEERGWITNYSDIEDRPFKDIAKETILKHPIPLVEQDDKMIEKFAGLISMRYQYPLRRIEDSGFGRDVESRMMIARNRGLYLKKFNEWAIHNVVRERSQLDGLIKEDWEQASGPKIEEFKRIKDIDVSLRRQFESTQGLDLLTEHQRIGATLNEAITDNRIGGNGGTFGQYFYDSIHNKLISDRNQLLQKLIDKKGWSKEEEFLNNNVRVDLSDDGLKALIQDAGDAPYRDYFAGFVLKFAQKQYAEDIKNHFSPPELYAKRMN